MNHFRGVRPSLWSRLKGGRLTRLGSEDAVVAFPKRRPFSKNSLEKNTGEIKLIEDCLEELTGKRLSLKLELSEDVRAVAEEAAPAGKPPADAPEKSKVDKVVSFFEGEILG